ncbi:MAG: manganese efflux pump [Clostridia bacterium]|nr:manganese efflux pump [Clostridia bacterium]
MSFIELLIMGVALSMDAFAVSICKGLKMRPFNIKQALLVGLFFGGAQGLMPLIGWFLGKQFESYITSFDHWIAFVLLAFIGIKMIIEALKKDDGEECDCCETSFKIGELAIMAIATSIDALAVGITFGLLPNVNILSGVSIIGITTFTLCIGGTFIGYKFGSALKNKAEIAGGIVLVLIGLKILLEHLGILVF